MNSKLRQALLNSDRARIILSNLEDSLQEDFEEQVLSSEDIDSILEENKIDEIFELSRKLFDLVDDMQDRVIS